uniref:Uncharacterized protein n=1 Tax=Clytia hemisphaerica TaxID=252671 RepID=A0A7M5X7G3_9CNID|eukprot:TCONS_00048092-protein
MASRSSIVMFLLLVTFLSFIECYPRFNDHRISRRSPQHSKAHTKELGDKLIAFLNNLKDVSIVKDNGITTLSRGTSCFPTGKKNKECTVKFVNGALKTICEMIPEIVCN